MMNKRFDKIVHSKYFVIVLILIFICLTALLGTYAWFTWSSTDNTSITMTIGKMADVLFSNGNEINSDLTPVFDYTDGLSTSFNINNRDTTGAMIGYSVKFNITSIASELISEDVKYVLVKNDSVVSKGDLSSVSNGSSITVFTSTLDSGITSYTFYLYIDGNEENDPNMMGKTIVGNITLESPLELGDYVSYTPTVTSYPTDTIMTGYSSSQTIYPEELNLWRVLNKNSDGSVEIISEYVSSTAVYFLGQTGYLNYVGYLNTLARQYETEGITNGSRHFGYNGQTEFLNPDDVEFTNPPPFSSSTIDNSNESIGGGDILYEKDLNQLQNVLGTMETYRVGTTSVQGYCIASRFYYYSSDVFMWSGRRVMNDGSFDDGYAFYYYDGEGFGADTFFYHLRPIVTLKPGLTYTGQGTNGSPWQIVS